MSIEHRGMRFAPSLSVILSVAITGVATAQSAGPFRRLPPPDVASAGPASAGPASAGPTSIGAAAVATPHAVVATPHPSATHSGTRCGECGAASGCVSDGGCARCMRGVDCLDGGLAEARWDQTRPLRFDVEGPGGYAGPPRIAHLSTYRLRPGDRLELIYLVTRRQTAGAYQLTPGDEVLIESLTDDDLQRGTLDRGLKIQPDGTITLRLLGQVYAAGLTISQLREVLESEYERFYEQPAIDVTPVRTNALAEDIRDAVGGQNGFAQQSLDVTVMPEGVIRLPGIGKVSVQGMSLDELKREINLRYSEVVVGLEIEPLLAQQAPHSVYVLGEVRTPDRVLLDAPTTVLGAIASAGGPLPGGNLRQVVVFRRAEDWRLISTMLDLSGAVYGKRPTPADEIWVRDGDVIIVPEKPIRRFDNWVRLVFTEGIYGVVPFAGVSVNYGDFGR